MAGHGCDPDDNPNLEAIVRHDCAPDEILNENEINCAQLLPEPLLKIDIQFTNSEIKALIDTGAASNMIRKSLADEIGETVIKDSSRIIKGLGEKLISTLGIICIPFSFYGVKIEDTPFHVVDDKMIKNPVILGKKFCSISKLVIDVHNRRITKDFSDGSHIDIYLQEKSTKLCNCLHEGIKIYAAEDIELFDDLSKTKIYFERNSNGLMNSSNKLLCFEGKNGIALDGLMDSTAEDNYVLVRKLPSSVNRQRICKGEVLGEVSSVVEIEDEGIDREWSMDRLRKDIKFGETITPDQKDQVLQVLLQTKSALSTVWILFTLIF